MPNSGALGAVRGSVDPMPDDKGAAVQAAFSGEDMADLKFLANIPACVEGLEGKTLGRTKAATQEVRPIRTRHFGSGARARIL